MSKDIVRVYGPYVLEKGQGLLDQDPIDNAVAKMSQKYGLQPGILNEEIIKSAVRFEELPRLPYCDQSTELALRQYHQLGEVLQAKYSKLMATQLIDSLKGIGNMLIRYPNWLTYIRISRLDFPKSYDHQGAWKENDITEEKKLHDEEKVTRVVERPQMDAALSYPYWAYLNQIKIGLIKSGEIDPTVLREAEVTGLMRRFQDKQALTDRIEPISPEEQRLRERSLGIREWQLIAAPRIPILLPERQKNESRNDYKMRLIDGWDEIGGKDPKPIVRRI